MLPSNQRPRHWKPANADLYRMAGGNHIKRRVCLVHRQINLRHTSTFTKGSVCFHDLKRIWLHVCTYCVSLTFGGRPWIPGETFGTRLLDSLDSLEMELVDPPCLLPRPAERKERTRKELRGKQIDQVEKGRKSSLAANALILCRRAVSVASGTFCHLRTSSRKDSRCLKFGQWCLTWLSLPQWCSSWANANGLVLSKRSHRGSTSLLRMKRDQCGACRSGGVDLLQ